MLHHYCYDIMPMIIAGRISHDMVSMTYLLIWGESSRVCCTVRQTGEIDIIIVTAIIATHMPTSLACNHKEQSNNPYEFRQ